MKIPFDKQWLVLEREDYANYLFASVTWEQLTSKPKLYGFLPGTYYGIEYIDSSCNLFVPKNEYDKINKEHFRMLFTNPKAWDRLHKITVTNSKKLFRMGKGLLKLKPQNLSDKQLVQTIDRFQEAQADVHVPRGPMFLLETPDNIVTNYLIDYLREKGSDSKKTRTKLFEAFHILSTPLQESVWAKEKESLANIAQLKNNEVQQKALKRHAKKYEWLEYGLQGKILPPEHFEKELNILSKRIKSGRYRSYRQQAKEILRRQKQVTKEYNIHPSHQRIFKIVRDSFYTRLYSKDSQFFGYYCMEPLLREFGRRTALTLEQIRFLAHRDFREALLKAKDFSQICNERQKYSLNFSDQGKTDYYFGNTAKRIRRKLKFIKRKQRNVKSKTLQGQPAFPGKAKGRVKIINTIPEMAKMHIGNILVSHMTNPGIVPAMKMATAIVTDLGGITCHAAIVARELKKPCVIGTKIATQVLKDGDIVEVDANRGIVKKL